MFGGIAPRLLVTHAYVAAYEDETSLDMHEDDADVSINVCLRRCKKARLTFCGLEGSPSHRRGPIDASALMIR